MDQASPPALGYWSMTSEESSDDITDNDGSSTRYTPDKVSGKALFCLRIHAFITVNTGSSCDCSVLLPMNISPQNIYSSRSTDTCGLVKIDVQFQLLHFFTQLL